MNIALLILVLGAVWSPTLTKLAVRRGPELELLPWWKQAAILPVSFLLWGFVLFPFFLGSEWADDVARTQRWATHTFAKVMVMVLCWLVLSCQYWYRVGYRAAVEQGR